MCSGDCSSSCEPQSPTTKVHHISNYSRFNEMYLWIHLLSTSHHTRSYGLRKCYTGNCNEHISSPILVAAVHFNAMLFPSAISTTTTARTHIQTMAISIGSILASILISLLYRDWRRRRCPVPKDKKQEQSRRNIKTSKLP
jgi:hypothetical protein